MLRNLVQFEKLSGAEGALTPAAPRHSLLSERNDAMRKDYRTSAKRRKPTKPIILSERLVADFWKCVQLGLPDECWEWKGGRIPQGYGRLWDYERRVDLRAIRVCYAIHYGEVPTHLMVRHTCDNPPCVNPAHLILGTAQDNTDDAKVRRRHSYGEKNKRHRMTEPQARAAHLLYSTGRFSRAEVAYLVGVPLNCITASLRGKSWGHLDLPPLSRPLRGEMSPNAKLTEADVQRIRALYAAGVSRRALADSFAVARGTIQRVVERRTWRHVA
jgi:hypothetical protein